MRFQGGGAADVTGGDVARVGVHLQVVIARHGDLELHPELRICGVRVGGEKLASDFHARRRGSSLERIILQKLRRRGSARIRLHMHRISHDRRGACFDGHDIYRTEVGDQPESQTFFGFQHAAAKDGSARRAGAGRFFGQG